MWITAPVFVYKNKVIHISPIIRRFSTFSLPQTDPVFLFSFTILTDGNGCYTLPYPNTNVQWS